MIQIVQCCAWLMPRDGPESTFIPCITPGNKLVTIQKKPRRVHSRRRIHDCPAAKITCSRIRRVLRLVKTAGLLGRCD